MPTCSHGTLTTYIWQRMSWVVFMLLSSIGKVDNTALQQLLQSLCFKDLWHLAQTLLEDQLPSADTPMGLEHLCLYYPSYKGVKEWYGAHKCCTHQWKRTKAPEFQVLSGKSHREASMMPFIHSYSIQITMERGRKLSSSDNQQANKQKSPSMKPISITTFYFPLLQGGGDLFHHIMGE